MTPRIFANGLLPPAVESLLSQNSTFTCWRGEEPMAAEALAAALADADGFICKSGKVDDRLLAKAPKLKVVANIGVGYNNIDVAALKARGIWGTHTPSVLDETVADLVVGLMLASARRIAELDHAVRAGAWTASVGEDWFGVDVHGATLGIIGMGRIGEAIARRARFGFGMEVIYSNRSARPAAEEKLGVSFRSLDDLLAQADFIALMAPLTPETVKLIGAAQFARMKPGAIFINASRGATVDEAALIAAVQAGRIRGAALDVFEQEPIAPDNPLLALPNVTLTPHIGSATHKTRVEMALLAARNAIEGAHGRVPPNVVPELRDLAL